MIIGNLKYDAGTDTFAGDLVTLHFQLTGIVIQPVKEKSSDKAPDYRIVYHAQHGSFEIGACWKRKAKKDERDYVSVQLDAPLLEAPINARIFFEEDAVTASMIWNRAKPEGAAVSSAT